MDLSFWRYFQLFQPYFGEGRPDAEALLPLSLPWDVGRRFDISGLSSPKSQEHLWHLALPQPVGPKSALPQINVHYDYFPAKSFYKPCDTEGGREQDQNQPFRLRVPSFLLEILHGKYKLSPSRWRSSKETPYNITRKKEKGRTASNHAAVI